MGKGVAKAVANVNNDIAPALLVSCWLRTLLYLQHDITCCCCHPVCCHQGQCLSCTVDQGIAKLV
jgi:hypothetical protein